MHRQDKQAGLTLVEMVATIVIIGIALAGVVAALSSGLLRGTNTLIETRAAALAASYLDEILAKRFDENASATGLPPCSTDCSPAPGFGPDPGESDRQDYDDVDDYQLLNEGAGQALPLRDAAGQARSGYAGFSVSVQVRYLQPGPGGADEGLGTMAGELNDAVDAKVITLTIAHEALGGGLQFSAYKANF